ncbi:MAG: DUF1735 domain-containing protein [Rikenellaceae bacterium]|jgi:hypothetical protein|nr:DUF1735 domain-containing protein [Rikenellaceae bacterium]
MRKTYNSCRLLAAVLLAGAITTGCDYDRIDPGKPEWAVPSGDRDFVYVHARTDNIFSGYNLYNTGYSVHGNVEAEFQSSILRAQEVDVEVGFAVDNSLIETYNKRYGATAVALPPSVTVDLGTGKTLIPAGSLTSADTLRINVSGFTPASMTGRSYVIPVKIASVTRTGKVEASETFNTVYILINNTVGNVIASRTTIPPGTSYAVTSFTASCNVAINNPNNMFTASTTQYTTLTASAATPPEIVIDMQSEQTDITGVAFNNRTSNQARLWTTVDVYTSSDNVDWVSQSPGGVTLGVNSDNSTQSIAFRDPIPAAQYLKVIIKGWNNAALSIRNFYLYTN